MPGQDSAYFSACMKGHKVDIRDLQPDDADTVEQVAALLVAGFREHWPDAWSTLESARSEVRESFGPDRLSRVALDEQGMALGWVGGIRTSSIRSSAL